MSLTNVVLTFHFLQGSWPQSDLMAGQGCLWQPNVSYFLVSSSLFAKRHVVQAQRSLTDVIAACWQLVKCLIWAGLCAQIIWPRFLKTYLQHSPMTHGYLSKATHLLAARTESQKLSQLPLPARLQTWCLVIRVELPFHAFQRSAPCSLTKWPAAIWFTRKFIHKPFTHLSPRP